MTDTRVLNGSAQTLRPRHVNRVSCGQVAEWICSLGQNVREVQEASHTISGITMDSREVQKGDLYVALPGAKVHGASFVCGAAERGAVAVLTDDLGLELMQKSGGIPDGLGLVVTADLRAVVGPLSARIYDSQPASGGAPRLFAVTGTNGKTTTTYMTNSIMKAMGHSTGLIGTIEILAGGQAIPSQLTTPESPHVHSLIALMREQGITSAAMEVSSHALDYRRIDGLTYDVAGFTNLTQDHLDLHGTMESYFNSKAELFTPQRTRKAVITVDDQWGQKMAERATLNLGSRAVVRLATNRGAGYKTESTPATLGPSDWKLTQVEPSGIGHRFVLERGDGFRLSSSTHLPADFNVSNAALAAVMVFESAHHELERTLLVEKLALPETLTPVVPGRMQLIATAPTTLVDFAHNPDALKRALQAIKPASEEGKVIIVFGATGERDQTKRPLMGQIAATYADAVIITDDDPHGEDPAPIRQSLEAGARDAVAAGARAQQIFNVHPRAAAIERAVALASPSDAVLIAGRGHEVAQDIAGTAIELDDRVEVARALLAAGYDVLASYQNEQK